MVNQDQVLDIGSIELNRLRALKAEPKFHPLNFYPGAPTETLRINAEEHVNRLLDRLIDALPDHPTKRFLMAQFELALAGFQQSDTEERERFFQYLEQVMEITGVESSDGLLNSWMYGFDPSAPPAAVNLGLQRDQERHPLRRILLSLSFFGVLLFGGALVLSFLNPLLVERGAREVVRIEVERNVGARIDSLSQSRIAGFARRTLENTDGDIERSQRAIRNEVPNKVAAVMAAMLASDCECRKRLGEYIKHAESTHLSSLTQVRERLASLIESAYASVTGNLIREFRIFAASNAVAFALLGAITLIRKNAVLQLALAAVVLVGAVIVTGSVYLFNQNWLHTIVFGQYVGLAYCFYLTGIAALLADVLFNRARVTTQLVNLILGMAGSMVTC